MKLSFFKLVILGFTALVCALIGTEYFLGSVLDRGNLKPITQAEYQKMVVVAHRYGKSYTYAELKEWLSNPKAENSQWFVTAVEAYGHAYEVLVAFEKLQDSRSNTHLIDQLSRTDPNERGIGAAIRKEIEKGEIDWKESKIASDLKESLESMWDPEQREICKKWIAIFEEPQPDQLPGTEDSSPKLPELSTNTIASIETTCGSIQYVKTSESKISKGEEETLRAILSYLYDGGRIVFNYPSAPVPILTPSTLKHMDIGYFVAQIKAKGIQKPSPPQILEELKRAHDQDPTSFHFHEGPAIHEIKKRISDPLFSQRTGNELLSLIQSRMDGQWGNRSEIIERLGKSFGFLSTNQIQRSAECHEYYPGRE